MAKYGMLVDVGKCIGCHACTAACKVKNNLPDGVFWTKVGAYERGIFPNVKVYTAPLDRCMHCEHPACVSACPVGALQKMPDGPVVYDARKCLGCRYCMTACPFHIPKLNWDALLPSIQKCQLCADRLAAGLDPACASACPTGALKFGDRDALLAEARERIQTGNGRYVNHIFGENELGGTTLLYISPVPFEELGFPKVSTEPVTKLSEQVVSYVPYGLGGLAVALSGLYWFFHRRERLLRKGITVHHDHEGKEE